MRFLALLLLLLAPSLARAQAVTHIRPALVAESAVPAAGSRTAIALVMKAAPGWHGYWKNPGDAGVETQIMWSAPAGVTVGPLDYPVPRTLIVSGLMNYVYEGDYAQPMTLAIPAGLAPGTRLPLRGKAGWLACTNEICVPETATVALDLTVGDGTVAPARQAEFDRYRAALPKPLGSRARFQAAGDRFRLAVPLPAAATVAEAYFFPLTEGAIDYAAPQLATRDGDRLVIETKAAAGAPPERIEGVLKIGEGQGLAIVALPGTVGLLVGVLAGSVKRREPWQVLGNQVVMARIKGVAVDLAQVPTTIRAQVASAQLGYAAGLPFQPDSWGGYPAARER